MLGSIINGINRILGRGHGRQSNLEHTPNVNNNSSKIELIEVDKSSNSSMDDISLSDFVEQFAKADSCGDKEDLDKSPKFCLKKSTSHMVCSYTENEEKCRIKKLIDDEAKGNSTEVNDGIDTAGNKMPGVFGECYGSSVDGKLLGSSVDQAVNSGKCIMKINQEDGEKGESVPAVGKNEYIEKMCEQKCISDISSENKTEWVMLCKDGVLHSDTDSHAFQDVTQGMGQEASDPTVQLKNLQDKCGLREVDKEIGDAASVRRNEIDLKTCNFSGDSAEEKPLEDKDMDACPNKTLLEVQTENNQTQKCQDKNVTKKVHQRNRDRAWGRRKNRSDCLNWRQPKENMGKKEENDPNDKEPENFVDMIRWKIDRKSLHDPKKLVYSLGRVKGLSSLELQHLLKEQYKIAEAKMNNDWVKQVRYFSEVVLDIDWIDKNIPPLGQSSYVPRNQRPEWKEKRERLAKKGQKIYLEEGSMCQDIRLKSDPTIHVLRENAADAGENCVEQGQNENKIDQLYTMESDKLDTSNKDIVCSRSDSSNDSSAINEHFNIIEEVISHELSTFVQLETSNMEDIHVVSMTDCAKQNVIKNFENSLEEEDELEKENVPNTFHNQDKNTEADFALDTHQNDSNVASKEAGIHIGTCELLKHDTLEEVGVSGCSHKIFYSFPSNELSLGAMETVSCEKIDVFFEAKEDEQKQNNEITGDFIDPAIVRFVKTEEELKRYPYDRSSPDHDYLIQYDGTIYNAECSKGEAPDCKGLMNLIFSGKTKEDSDTESPYMMADDSLSETSEPDHHHYDSQSPESDSNNLCRICHHNQSPDHCYHHMSMSVQSANIITDITSRGSNEMCNESSGIVRDIHGISSLKGFEGGKILDGGCGEPSSPLLCGQDLYLSDTFVTEKTQQGVSEGTAFLLSVDEDLEEKIMNVETLTDMVRSCISDIDLNQSHAENFSDDQKQEDFSNLEDYMDHKLQELVEVVSEEQGAEN